MRGRRGLVGAALAGLLVVGGATAASAHVTVQPPEAEQGSFAKLTFRVPNERPENSTVQLRISFPEDHPIPAVSVKPKTGWEAEVTMRTLDTPIDLHGREVSEVVSEITWSGGQIQPGQFDEFEVSAGTLPTDTDVLFFPAIQIYDNGEEVAWIEKPAADGEEPEKPAPMLVLTPSTGGGHGGGDMEGDEGMATPAAAEADGHSEGAASASDDHEDSDTLAIAALALALLGVVLGGAALARSGKSKA